jgi:predicted phosphodiesterase
MRIGIIGDLHIAPVPAKRLDNYFQTGLNKIEEIASGCDIAIFLGDIFTNVKVDELFVNPLMRKLKECTVKYGTKFVTIIGNHDVQSEEESNLDGSSLGTLFSSGAIDIILPDKPFEADGYRFNTVPVKFKNAKEYIQGKKYEKNDILLVHHEYETGTNCFSYNDFKDLGMSMVFLGHDHKPIDGGRIVYPEFTVYRSGSIMRNRGDEYNFTRPLYYYRLENGVVSCVPVTTIPFDKVFKVETINKLELQERKFTESIDSIIEKYENNITVQNRFSIKSILEELNAREEIIDYIKKQYEKAGEVFC